MDFLVAILTSVAGGIATQAGRTVYDWLKVSINNALKDQSEAAIIKALDAIGNM
jgi:hypothetical protein